MSKLVWKADPPTEPGWYWFAWEFNGALFGNQVIYVQPSRFNRPSRGFVKGDMVQIGRSVSALGSDPRHRYAGPIPQPTDTEELDASDDPRVQQMEASDNA